MIGTTTPLLLGFNGPSTPPDADTLEVAAALLGAEMYQALLLNNVTIRNDDREFRGRGGWREIVPGVRHLDVEAQGCGEMRAFVALRGVEEFRKACRRALLRARAGEAFLEFKARMLERHPGTCEDVIASAWEAAHPDAAKALPLPVAPRLKRVLEVLSKIRIALRGPIPNDAVAREELDRATLLVGEALERYEQEACARVEELRAQVLKWIEDGLSGSGAMHRPRVKALRERVQNYRHP